MSHFPFAGIRKSDKQISVEDIQVQMWYHTLSLQINEIMTHVWKSAQNETMADSKQELEEFRDNL